MSDETQLTPAAFAAVRRVFAAACELPIDQRRAFIDSECGEDSVVQRAVLELLTAHEDASDSMDADTGSFAKQVLAIVSTQPGSAPEQIGPYKIRGVIGQGGMGVVYLAEQSNPQREVALKIVRRGFSGGTIQSRFGREIRVLGKLEHPGITRIYEAGSAQTADGPVTYFAMEYVRGERLDTAAETMGLDINARVELVAKVADAVQHAHTKGVIHRDLKPANILVSDAGNETGSGTGTGQTGLNGPQPKILDFGVARVLEPDTVQTAITEAGLVIGTVAYMSPEQLSGDTESIDARSDVYSIGVILYEMLTGRMPYELRGKPIAEAARIVRDEKPMSLRSTANTVKGSLDRDLETIVLRAIAKERERRYATAAALAEDLRRFLRDEPILARPPTVRYTIAKFSQRHTGLVIAATLAIVALVGGLVMSTIMFMREQRAREVADAKDRLNSAVRGYMIEGLLMAAGPDRMGYDVKMLDVLTHASEGLHERFKDDPEVEASIRGDLGTVLSQIGKFKESKAELSKTIELLEKTAGHNDIQTIQAILGLATTLQQMHDDEAWLTTANDAMTRARVSLPEGHPQRLLAQVHVGGALISLHRLDEGRKVLNEGIATYEKHREGNRESGGNLYNWLGVCEQIQGDKAATLEIRKKSLEFMVREYGEDHRDTVVARANLAVAYKNVEDVDKAIETFKGIPEAMERLYPPGHPSRDMAYGIYGILLGSANRFEESELYMMKAYDTCTANAPEFDWSTETRIHGLRQLYARWPGHREQLLRWCCQGVKARMMLAHANEEKNLPDVLSKVLEQFAEANEKISRTEILDVVWERRDDLAPKGHLRRAAFYANYARAGAIENHREHFDEALTAAEESLAYATEADVAKELVAEARAIRQPTKK